MCIITFSTNILAVALSGLIVEKTATVTFPIPSSQHFTPNFNENRIFNITFTIPYYDHFYTAMSNLTDGTLLPPWIDEKKFYLPLQVGNPQPFTSTGAPLSIQSIRGSTTGIGADLSCFDLSKDRNANNTVVFDPDAANSTVFFETTHVLQDGTRVKCYADTGQIGNTTIFTGNLTSGPSALEVMDHMAPVLDSDNTSFCISLIVAGWVRLGAENSAQNSPSNNSVSGRSLDYTFIGCTPKLRIATFDVYFDTANRIISSERTSNYSEDTSQHFTNSSSERAFFKQANDLVTPFSNGDFKWHNDSFTGDWMNSVLGFQIQSDSLVNPSAPVPNAANATALMKDMYARLFALVVGLNTHVLVPQEEDVQTMIVVEAAVERLFISAVMFQIAVVLLALQAVVAVLYYWKRPKLFLPRMPTTIATIVGMVENSRALEYFGGDGRDGDENGRGRSTRKKDWEERYGYGRFIGTDGKTHVGIEKQRYVVALKSQNPLVKKRTWSWRKSDEKEPKIWI